MFKPFPPMLRYKLNPDDFMEDGGGPPSDNPALIAAGLTAPVSKIDPTIPVTDPGDEFEGDDGSGGMNKAPRDENLDPPEAPAGDQPPKTPTPSPADSSVIPAAPAGDSTPPDAMPGEAEFDAWAAADPKGAQRYLDSMQADNDAEAAATQEGPVGAEGTPFADANEQRVNVRVHLQTQNREYTAALEKYNKEREAMKADEQILEDGIKERKAENERRKREGDTELPLEDQIINVARGRLQQQKQTLAEQKNTLNAWNTALDRIEEANTLVDELPQLLGPYRELVAELASQGRFDKCRNFDAQKSVINTELVARGMPRIGEKRSVSTTPRNEPSDAVKRYRALRAGTAPTLTPGKDKPPPVRRQGPPADDGMSKLAPHFRDAVLKIAKK